MELLVAVELDRVHERITGEFAPDRPVLAVLFEVFLQAVDIRCSWRIPIQVITGPSSLNTPLGRTCPTTASACPRQRART